jgi:peroxiredoxin
VEETPSLEKLSAQLQPMGVEVIAVSVDQDPAALAKFIANYHLSFPVALDPDQTVASTYGTSVFPETYILDRQGRVAEKIIGGRDWEDPLMVSFVDSLARGGGSPKQ